MCDFLRSRQGYPALLHPLPYSLHACEFLAPITPMLTVGSSASKSFAGCSLQKWSEHPGSTGMFFKHGPKVQGPKIAT